MELEKNRHSVYSLKYHLVLITKYRHKCINKVILERLKEIVERLFNLWSCDIIEIEGEKDHLHLLFSAPPQIQVSKLVNNLKTTSSRLIRKEFSEHLRRYYWKPYFWSRSYCVVSAGGAPLELIKQYIDNQDKPKE